VRFISEKNAAVKKANAGLPLKSFIAGVKNHPGLSGAMQWPRREPYMLVLQIG